MLRDQAEETMDMEVLEEAEIEDLNQDSIRGYRNSHKSFKPGHPFERLDDNEYLRVIGVAGILKDNFIFLLDYKNAIFSIKICIDHAVRQCFPKAELLGLSMARTREILSIMDDVEAIGRNKKRIYRLRKEFFKN